MSLSRIVWVDHLKALGIFLVVLGHHGIPRFVGQLIYSFHVPLFFFIAGYLFDFQRFGNARQFLFQRFRTLIIPYFSLAVVNYLFWLIVVRSLPIGKGELQIPATQPLLGIFYAVGVGQWRIPLSAALWFLPCLFVTELLFWGIGKLCKQNKLKIACALLVAGIAGYMDSTFIRFRFPWSMDVALTAVVFYGMGFVLKEDVVKKKNTAFWDKMVMAGACYALLAFFCFFNRGADMNGNHYNNPGLFYAAAFFGIYGTIGVSQMIPSNRLMAFIGRNTLLIMGLHGMALFVLKIIFNLCWKTTPPLGSISLASGVALSVAQIVLLVPAIWMINRYFPFLLGRKNPSA